MMTFEITYIRTGRVNDTDKVWISSGDERRNGEKVQNIMDAIECFEELAEDWGTYENKHAITGIKVIEFKS